MMVWSWLYSIHSNDEKKIAIKSAYLRKAELEKVRKEFGLEIFTTGIVLMSTSVILRYSLYNQ